MDVTNPTPRQVLALQLKDTDIGDVPLRVYLHQLFEQVWLQGSDFSGKRPFGNSDWQWRVYDAMHRAGWVAGERDDEGELDLVDIRRADSLILLSAQALWMNEGNPDEPIELSDDDDGQGNTSAGGLDWNDA